MASLDQKTQINEQTGLRASIRATYKCELDIETNKSKLTNLYETNKSKVYVDTKHELRYLGK